MHPTTKTHSVVSVVHGQEVQQPAGEIARMVEFALHFALGNSVAPVVLKQVHGYDAPLSKEVWNHEIQHELAEVDRDQRDRDDEQHHQLTNCLDDERPAQHVLQRYTPRTHCTQTPTRALSTVTATSSQCRRVTRS